MRKCIAAQKSGLKSPDFPAKDSLQDHNSVGFRAHRQARTVRFRLRCVFQHLKNTPKRDKVDIVAAVLWQ